MDDGTLPEMPPRTAGFWVFRGTTTAGRMKITQRLLDLIDILEPRFEISVQIGIGTDQTKKTLRGLKSSKELLLANLAHIASPSIPESINRLDLLYLEYLIEGNYRAMAAGEKEAEKLFSEKS